MFEACVPPSMTASRAEPPSPSRRSSALARGVAASGAVQRRRAELLAATAERVLVRVDRLERVGKADPMAPAMRDAMPREQQQGEQYPRMVGALKVNEQIVPARP